MATISDFKANLSGGGARSNQFSVTLIPPALVANSGNAGRAIGFLCKAASLPGSQIADVPVFYRGRPVHLAGERDFQPWNLTIYNDTDFLIRDAFEAWSHLMVNYNATDGQPTPLAYQVDAVVSQLDRNGVVLKSYTFHDCWPTDIGQIDLDYEQNNVIETFPVTLQYNYFEPLRIAGA
jgi:hypothetical protein